MLVNKRDAASDDERESGGEVEEEEEEFSDVESTDEEAPVAKREAASGDEEREPEAGDGKEHGAEEEEYEEAEGGEEGAEEEGEEEQQPAPEPVPRLQRKKLEPFEVPTSGAFWLHDDRFEDTGAAEEGGGLRSERDEVSSGRRKLWDPSSEDRWGHDKFEALERGEDVYDDEETLAAFNRMSIRRGRGRGEGRGRGGGRGRGRGREYPEATNGAPQYATARIEFVDEDAPPPGFEDAVAQRTQRAQRGQPRGGAGAQPSRRPAPTQYTASLYEPQEPVAPAGRGRGRGRGRGGRGPDAVRDGYAAVPSSYAPVPNGGGRGGQQPQVQRRAQGQQQQQGVQERGHSYEAQYPSLPSAPPRPGSRSSVRSQQGPNKQLNVEARNFEPVAAPAPAATAPAPLVAPSQQLAPAPPPQPPQQNSAVAAAHLTAQQSAMALQQIASGGAPSFAMLQPPLGGPQQQPGAVPMGYTMQPMQAMQMQPMQYGMQPVQYVAVPYGAPTGMPMSGPPTYVAAAVPQMSGMEMMAPMPAAPVAPVPVKRPLTISAPQGEEGSSQGAGAGGYQAEGGGGVVAQQQQQQQRSARGGGGRRYSAKTGGLAALD